MPTITDSAPEKPPKKTVKTAVEEELNHTSEWTQEWIERPNFIMTCITHKTQGFDPKSRILFMLNRHGTHFVIADNHKPSDTS